MVQLIAPLGQQTGLVAGVFLVLVEQMVAVERVATIPGQYLPRLKAKLVEQLTCLPGTVTHNGFGDARFGAIELSVVSLHGCLQFFFVLQISLIAVPDGPQGDFSHRHGNRRKLDRVVVLPTTTLVEHLVQFIPRQRSHDTSGHDR